MNNQTNTANSYTCFTFEKLRDMLNYTQIGLCWEASCQTVNNLCEHGFTHSWCGTLAVIWNQWRQLHPCNWGYIASWWQKETKPFKFLINPEYSVAVIKYLNIPVPIFDNEHKQAWGNVYRIWPDSVLYSADDLRVVSPNSSVRLMYSFILK